MDVVLLERVAKLGQMGDVVSVKNGFARNFLMPQGKALRATKANLAAFEAGSLFGSVSNRDAADVASEGGFTLNKKQIVLERPIKDLGLHNMTVVLHPEVSATIVINVARSTEEAELQASGKSIVDLAAEAEAEAEFEIAELFDDIGAAASDDEDLIPSDEEPAKDAAEEDLPM